MDFSADSILKTYRSLSFVQVFIFSLLVLLLLAIFHQSPVIYLLVSVFYLNAVLVALSVSGTSLTVCVLLVVLWVLSLITRWFVPSGLDLLFLILSKGMAGVLLFVTIFYISHYILTSKRVTIDALFAALVVYILMAILFAQLYSIMEALSPGSFLFPAYMTGLEGRIADITFNYYSFVTIATLGYGDITPCSPITQMLASIEAMTGQFYVAIVVAWLVSLFAAEMRETRR